LIGSAIFAVSQGTVGAGFYQPDAIPVTQPTLSEQSREPETLKKLVTSPDQLTKKLSQEILLLQGIKLTCT